MQLEESGRKILEILAHHVKTVSPGKPETYIGYKIIHDLLKLPYLGSTYGDSLKKQGLKELADWTKMDGLPAITGIIINLDSYEPGKGYFKLFDRQEGDYSWWQEEVKKSKEFDWSPYIQLEFDPKPVDFEVPERSDTKISRIIRDSSLATHVKVINCYECQLCGLALDMPQGRKYAEAHHIQPLGKPHNGPDVKENMICLCPNHHALVDYGAVSLSFDNIDLKPDHKISENFLIYHNENIWRSDERD